MNMERERPEPDDIQDHRDRLKSLLNWLILRKVDGRLEARIDRETVVQDTMLKALRWRRKSPDEPIRDLRSWLNRILIHTLMDEIRRVARDNGVDLDDVQDASTGSIGRLEMLVGDVTSPSGRFGREEDERRLAAAIARLSDTEQAVVRLCKLEVPPRSHAEVARELGKSVPAVRGLLARAIMKLHDDLSE